MNTISNEHKVFSQKLQAEGVSREQYEREITSRNEQIVQLLRHAKGLPPDADVSGLPQAVRAVLEPTAKPAGYHVIKECGAVGCSVSTLEEAERAREFWNKNWTIRPYFYAAQARPVNGINFFSYETDRGFETFKTAEEAISSAQGAIDDYQGDACDGWPDEVDSVCWGVVMQEARQCNNRPRDEEDTHLAEHIEYICDYELSPPLASAPVERAAPRDVEVQARVINEFIRWCNEKTAFMSTQNIEDDVHQNAAHAAGQYLAQLLKETV